ncbi:MAG: methionine adenosyltransferase [Elusimicrobia bacterium]|jgi:S-adenosylmethionine synthetase|nr:methionine adenosyltransferase [Elusimicrobiota bacterium]
MKDKTFTFTSESVTEGHPDKVSDQISDGILDEILKYDNEQGLTPYKLKESDKRGSRVACETFVSTGLALIGGEITTGAYVDFQKTVRKIVRDIGYTDPTLGFEADSLCLLNSLNEQSPDIALGVDDGGAGDQGLMIGYACKETEELMPLPIMLAHKLSLKLSEVRKDGTLGYLKPDGKSQVTVNYVDGKPESIETVVISSQHDVSIVDSSGKHITDEAKNDIIREVIKPIVPAELLTDDTKYLINPTGRFVVGGPQSDTGVTGRKIIVDTYGGIAGHGGGAFSGKDPSKVDRSATYAARYIAKNIVAAGLADKCTIQLAYAIGVKEPLNIMVYTNGTSVIPDEEIEKLVTEGGIFDLHPAGIVEMLNLWQPIYKKTASYGHFGREIFPWEKTDKADILKEKAGR